MEGVPLMRWVGLWACLAAGCVGAPASLEGSLTVRLGLSYQRAELLVDSQMLAVRFVDHRGEGEDTVLKVAVGLSGVGFQPGQTLDLAEDTPEGRQRGVASRDVLDEPRYDFPPLERGKLRLDDAATPGARVPGELSLTFVNGTELASGRTVYGHFEAQVP